MSKKTKRNRVILRAEPAKAVEIELRGESRVIEIEAKDGAPKGPPRFEMTIYAGGPIRPHTQPPLPHPVIIDLAGIDTKRQRIPALKDHDSKRHVGHTETLASDGRQLTATGVISGGGADAKEVVIAAGNGFVWPVSVGATLTSLELLKKDQTANVNGRNVTGPVFIARASRPREVSFLTIAADDDAAALIAAEAARKGEAMSFADWLKANGFQPEDKLTKAQRVILRAQFKGSNGVELDAAGKTQTTLLLEATETDDDEVDEPTPKPAPKPRPKPGEEDGVAELRAQFAALRREQSIRALCGADHADIAAKAIANEWNDDTVALAIEAAELRKGLPQSFSIKAGRAKDAPDQALVLEAALCTTGGLDKAEEKFDANVLTEANRQYRRGLGLQELLLEAAKANGYTTGSPLGAIKNDLRGVLMAATGVNMQAANFSTISLPGIFTSTANKFLLSGYTAVESVWRMIAATRSVSDFKTITSYRLTGNGTFEELPPDGEIRHGTLGEQSFTNRARTYAKMFSITRQDIINDDLDALTAIPRKLGRGAALKLNLVFWATWLADTTFFATSDANDNYISGATTNLGTVGLTAGLTKFRRQTDPDGNPLAIEPRFLLVPPELEVIANEIYTSTTFNTGGSATTAQVAATNVFARRYQPVTSAYLTNTTAWYLVADPNDIPAIEVAFLNGQQQPVVETADTDFNTLGVQMRGYHDFGVAFVDPRAALKSKGAA